MSALETPICDFGWPAADFSLTATDGTVMTLEDCRGPRATLVMFICNHCPFVKASLARIIHDVVAMHDAGIGSVAIMSNDIAISPLDGPGPMAELASSMQFPFPYLYDADQDVASRYGAVCTPDFFGFNQDLELQYRGRLDTGGQRDTAADCRRELFEAMLVIAESGRGPAEQVPSLGCSIKWRSARPG